MRRIIKLRESELRRIISESVLNSLIGGGGSLDEFEDDLTFDHDEEYPFDKYIGGGKRPIPTDDMLDPY